MMKDVVCCVHLSVADTVLASPFQRMIAVDYYDGFRAGLVECSVCRRVFAAEFLDWDDNQDVRVFALCPTQGVSLDDLSGLGAEPSWPLWVPFNDELHSKMLDAVDRLLAETRDVAFVVATRDLSKEISHVYVGIEHSCVDWFTFFGIERSRA